ncbi:MAG: sulfatase-like hydrolase/transferase [Verrucomicrobiota bacterium]|nr:sulfatase-like hydrolase/transferase [Verrucomicrobiota bacterium]
MKLLPNILFLCPDELQATALGCYGQSAPTSPYIDALAAKSARFSQCHTVHPKCQPSRAALLSGLYPHVFGHRTLQAPLTPSEPNFARILRQYGYQSVLSGKLHDVSHELQAETYDFILQSKQSRTWETPENTLPTGSYWVGQDPVNADDYPDINATHNAVEWLKGARDPTKPFFLSVNWHAPHPPYGLPAPHYGVVPREQVTLPPQDDSSNKPAYQAELQRSYGTDRFTPDDWREIIGTYYDMVRMVDTQIGQMVGALQSSGLLDNTIILIWSDHGCFAGQHQLVEKWDTSFYDCVTRVPLIIHHPKLVKPDSINCLIETIDIFPTIFGLIGLPIPEGIMGRDHSPLLRGEPFEERPYVFCQGGQELEVLSKTVAPFSTPRPCKAYQMKQDALWRNRTINARAKMIRDHNYKYCYHATGFEEFYDLKSDPSELMNQASNPSFTALLHHYRKQLIQKLVESENPFPLQSFLEA